jgi:hypothetical protein
MKVALCFWGLCRSTQYTIESIQRNIFEPLQDAQIDYTVYLHTYVIYHRYTNSRAGEYNIYLKNTNWKHLNPSKVSIENQDDVDKTLNFPQYFSKGDPWEDEGIKFSSLENHIRALWSLKQVTNLWMGSEKYDAVIYMRPDVLFVMPLRVEWLKNIAKNTVYIPNFHIVHNCNDRFAFGTPETMKNYGLRFNESYKYSLNNQLHSEKFLHDTMVSHGHTILQVPFRFRRIRSDGKPCEADMDL